MWAETQAVLNSLFTIKQNILFVLARSMVGKQGVDLR